MVDRGTVRELGVLPYLGRVTQVAMVITQITTKVVGEAELDHKVETRVRVGRETVSTLADPVVTDLQAT